MVKISLSNAAFERRAGAPARELNRKGPVRDPCPFQRPRSLRLPQALGGAAHARALPADVAGGDGRARLGRVRRHPRHRRRLRGPPELRHGHRRQAPRGAGLSRRHHCPARLALDGRFHAPRPPGAVLRRHGGQHGFDGQPLYGGPAHPQRRCLHARRRRRQTPGPQRRRLFAASARGLPRGARGHRRHRGESAAHRPFRLLAGKGPPIDPARLEGGPARFRQRRAADRRDRTAARGRGNARGDPRRARHGLRRHARRGGMDRDRFDGSRRAGPHRPAARSLFDARAGARASIAARNVRRRGRARARRQDRALHAPRPDGRPRAQLHPAPELRAGAGRPGALCTRLADTA